MSDYYHDHSYRLPLLLLPKPQQQGGAASTKGGQNPGRTVEEHQLRDPHPGAGPVPSCRLPSSSPFLLSSGFGPASKSFSRFRNV